MASGPTQNYDDPTLVSWRPHPALARALRIGLALLPIAVATATGLLAVRLLPPERIGVAPWLWLVLEVGLCALLLLAVGRLTRRLLPLTTLLRLTLVLPDQVPRRVAALRRPSTPDDLRARLEDASSAEAGPHAEVLLELVSALARHDRATFRHSERVQGYSTLIGRELGLGSADLARLGWAALLHDVGKVTVPTAVLNKPARPDPAEWAAISGHAAAGGELAAPLARWLGPWSAAIDEHHERWDGAGYPRGLAGEQISLSARVVAVADAYDVITSARAYKAPMPADAARAELARCAGAQFDPAVVRAFLAIGLGDLRRVAGPFALVGAIPALPLLQQGAVRTFARTSGAASTATAAAPGVAAAVVVGAGLAVATPLLSPPPVPVADSATVPVDAGGEDGAAGPVEEAPPAPSSAVLPGDGGPADAGPGASVPDGDGSGAPVVDAAVADPGPAATDPAEPAGAAAPGSGDGATSTPPAPPPTPTGPDSGTRLPPQASDRAREAVGPDTPPRGPGASAEPTTGRPGSE